MSLQRWSPWRRSEELGSVVSNGEGAEKSTRELSPEGQGMPGKGPGHAGKWGYSLAG